MKGLMILYIDAEICDDFLDTVGIFTIECLFAIRQFLASGVLETLLHGQATCWDLFLTKEYILLRDNY